MAGRLDSTPGLFLVTIADVAATQNPDTGQITFKSMLPTAAQSAVSRIRLRSAWFDFVTNSQSGTRDMGIDVRAPRASDGNVLHVYTAYPSTSQPFSKTWIWTFAPGLPNATSAAGNTISAPLPDMWLPATATFELNAAGPSGGSDQFTNINLWLEVV